MTFDGAEEVRFVPHIAVGARFELAIPLSGIPHFECGALNRTQPPHRNKRDCDLLLRLKVGDKSGKLTNRFNPCPVAPPAGGCFGDSGTPPIFFDKLRILRLAIVYTERAQRVEVSPREESNLDLRFRKPPSYPLNDEGE